MTEDGNYTVKNVYEDDTEFKTSDQDIIGALTKLRIRVAVKIKMKRRLDKTRDKILERRKSFLDNSILLGEQNKSKPATLEKPEKETNVEDGEKKKELAMRNSTKQHRMNLLTAV